MDIARIPIEWADHWNASTNHERFLRDLCGIRIRSKEDFIKNRVALYSIWDFSKANPYKDEIMYSFEKTWSCNNKDKRRFLHIDYGVSDNSAGLSMAYVDHFVNPKGASADLNYRPYIVFDFVARIPPSDNEEIILTDIEAMITNIKERGFPIGLITFDKFQSVQTMQNLKRKGFTVENLSLDRTSHYIKVVSRHEHPDGAIRVSTRGNYMVAWEAIRDLINENRIKIPFYKPLSNDFKNALRKIKLQKIVGKNGQSLDTLESVVGSAYNCIMNNIYLDEDCLKEFNKNEIDPFYNDPAFNNTTGYVEDDFYL